MLSNAKGEWGTDARHTLKEASLGQNPPFLPHRTSDTTDAHAAEKTEDLLLLPPSLP